MRLGPRGGRRGRDPSLPDTDEEPPAPTFQEERKGKTLEGAEKFWVVREALPGEDLYFFQLKEGPRHGCAASALWWQQPGRFVTSSSRRHTQSREAAASPLVACKGRPTCVPTLALPLCDHRAGSEYPHSHQSSPIPTCEEVAVMSTWRCFRGSENRAHA